MHWKQLLSPYIFKEATFKILQLSHPSKPQTAASSLIVPSLSSNNHGFFERSGTHGQNHELLHQEVRAIFCSTKHQDPQRDDHRGNHVNSTPPGRPIDCLHGFHHWWHWRKAQASQTWKSTNGCFQKYGYPKMDGENNGKPYEQMDHLGGKHNYFWQTPKCWMSAVFGWKGKFEKIVAGCFLLVLKM